MKTRRILQKAIKKFSRIPLASLNYHLGRYDNVTWLVSDGRSGSTWLSDLLNWDRKYRELFEPYHPFQVKQVKDFSLFQYLRIETTDSPLCTFLENVFTGNFKHLRADVSKPQLLYDGLLIKDIFAHLLMPWVDYHLPSVKKIILIRNPFSVALSKQKLSNNWIWMKNPKDFLEQKDLLVDYLLPYEDLIADSGDDFILNQILIWSIIHFIPLNSLDTQKIHIVFYEDLLTNPQNEIMKIFNFVGKHYSECEALNEIILKPTRTSSNTYSDRSVEQKIRSWESELSLHQIDRGMQILERFNFHRIYLNPIKPDMSSLLGDF